MVTENKCISADEFLDIVRAPAYDDRLVELINGEIVELPLHGAEHGVTVANLAARIGKYIFDNDLGHAFLGGMGYVVEKSSTGCDTIRGLDFAYVSKGRAPESWGDDWLETPPDLVVEVVEYCDSASYIQLKVMQILKSGTPQVWTISPENKTLVVHCASCSTTLEEFDTVTGGDILPGFTKLVADFFE
ncbi:MAG: Uma2 family endonuclease [Chloroflexi bacterium]|nr:Uma2 family endonuclease [Chloroflexota bacterium]